MALTNPFKPAQRENKRVKLLVYGEPGAGKTTLALQLQSIVGGKIALIDTEGGADLYADASGMPAFDVLRTKTYSDIQKALEFIQFGKHEYTLLVVDPITVIWNVIIEGVVLLRENALVNKGGNPDSVSLTFKDWGVIKRKMTRIYNLLVNLPVHVIVTAREKEEFEGEGDNRKKVGSKPDAEKSLDYLFDAILHLNRDAKGNRFALVKKDRSGQLKARIEGLTPASLAPLFDNQSSNPEGYHLPSDADAAAALATELEREEKKQQPAPTASEAPQTPEPKKSPEIRPAAELRFKTQAEVLAHLKAMYDASDAPVTILLNDTQIRNLSMGFHGINEKTRQAFMFAFAGNESMKMANLRHLEVLLKYTKDNEATQEIMLFAPELAAKVEG